MYASGPAAAQIKVTAWAAKQMPAWKAVTIAKVGLIKVAVSMWALAPTGRRGSSNSYKEAARPAKHLPKILPTVWIRADTAVMSTMTGVALIPEVRLR